MNISKLLNNTNFSVKADKKLSRSHLTHALNHRMHKAIRWCTPSIDLSSSQVKNPYLSDTSISYESLGFPSEPSGIFKKIYDHAAIAYGADHTLFSVNGTTGSNFTVLRTLSKQIPNLRTLAQRNIHKSVVAACEDYGINLMFLAPNVDDQTQIFVPNTEEQILEGIKKTKPQVLLLTNPTYEGITLNLKKVISSVKSAFPNIIIFIEEAWGAHLHFSKKLPISAMEAGADICVQSTHKQGGSLQQCGMIHWKDGLIKSVLLMDSYRSLSTTSPSLMLLASLDAARELMEKKGSQKIDHILSIADYLSKKINKIDGFKVITTNELKKRNPSVFSRDESKVILDVTNSDYTGFEIAKILEKNYNIVVEKYTINNLLFLIPFRATLKDVEDTAKALHEISQKINKKQEGYNLKMPAQASRILELSDVSKLLWNQIEKVPLEKAEGRIAAEHITPYPPGIPVTIKGEELTSEVISYYLKLKDYPNSHFIAQDKSLETVLVVR